ncbi:MAG: SUMF1/EgtB/PvdO family nonheme iron enzyme, partial [Nitrospinaceae bacterium]
MLSLILSLTQVSGSSGTPLKKVAPSPYAGMVLIPQGAFEMGSRESLRELNPVAIFQADRHMLGPEDPAHEVILDAFYMDIHEVSNADYKKYIAAAGLKKMPRYWDDTAFNPPAQPLVGVSWKEAQAFCQWKNKRLPTEAEWEKAARGKRPVKYPWGDEAPDKTRLNFRNHVGKTTAVGSYPKGKSDYGLFDMSGNVSEWVQDWHYPEYYLFSPKENPPGP